MKVLNKQPTFQEWFDALELILCDVEVLRTDGGKQVIFDCVFNYSINQVDVKITKKGWLVQEYFFVAEILTVGNYRMVGK